MTLSRFLSIQEYDNLLSQYKVKGCWSNNYMMADEVGHYMVEGTLYWCCTDHNLFVLNKKETCFRLYYCIGEPSEMFEVHTKEPIVIEILYRGGCFYPQDEISYLMHCGFKINLVRDFYLGRFADMTLESIDTNNVIIRMAETEEDVAFAVSLFNSSFDPFTGDYMDANDAKTFINEKSISIAYNNGVRLGACHAYEKNKIIYLGHLAVIPDARSKKVGMQLMNEMITRFAVDEKSRFSLWVQQENTAAVKLYERLGYKYASKSTVSLIKNNNHI